MDVTPFLEKPSVPVVLIPCRLGGMKVLHRDYYFDHHIARGPIKHYRCVEHARLECPARIIVKDSRVYDVETHHNHKHDKSDPPKKADNKQIQPKLPKTLQPGVSANRLHRRVMRTPDNPDGKQRGKGGPSKAAPKRPTLSAAEIQATIPGTPVVYLASRFGSAKVELNEHHYVFHYASGGVAYYRCEQFKQLQCPAQIVAVAGKVHPLSNDHTHTVDTKRQEQVASRYTSA
ncbi:AGAP003439-PH-like protein [Anopheles sinensis]|uniref:AGAP003439-PH-like protein n=1 Tax=Anopheles sinensis TaxID=74873 RepID=A0A084WSR9_ANOSI|nr:AGAP003439-PH-like protein [Anopheles sinensis]